MPVRASLPRLMPIVLLAACAIDEPRGPAGAQGGSGSASAGNAGSSSGGTAGSTSGGTAMGSALAGQAGAAVVAGSSGAGIDGAGSGGGGGSSGGAAPSGTATFVAVGYAGRRIRSTDGGVSWTDEQTLGGGGDDEFLLRGVSFGAGVFVALGWKILSSPDGKTWTTHDNPQNQWLAGVQFSSGVFIATGGYGYCAKSSDGRSWATCQSIPNHEASRSLAFGLGKFVTATDPGNWFESNDGSSWSLLSGGHQSNQVAFCDATFKEYADCSGVFAARARATAGGITIRVSDGQLERSSNGTDFAPVSGSPENLEAVAAGYVQ